MTAASITASARTTIILIRHAETALAGTFCGHSDPPLNERGRAQLSSLRERVSALCSTGALDAIFSSDLRRASETADCLAASHDYPVQLRPALRELDFGDWEGLKWEEIEARDPRYAARWVAEFPALPAPHGELIAHFKHRVLEEFSSLRYEAQSKQVAVVTHAGVLRILLEELGHLAPHHAWERTRDYTCTIRCSQTNPGGVLEIDR